jgi:Protein of unknown function (DUF1501)
VCRFADWCDGRGVGTLSGIRPMHAAAYIEALGDTVAKPTVKQHLAAIRMLFDWLVVGQVLDMNPAHAVRGLSTSSKRAAHPCSIATKRIAWNRDPDADDIKRALEFLLAAEKQTAMGSPTAPKAPHFAPRAKRVIFLFMDGGPSHLDTFDPCWIATT